MTALQPGDFVALALSLKVAAAAVLFGLPIALAVALALARGRFPGRSALDALINLPLVLPPVATGYILLLTFGAQGWVGRHLSKVGVSFAFDWTGAALASGVMAFPLMVRPIRQAIEAIDLEVEEAAQTLGALAWVRLVRIVIPLSAPGLLAAAVMGFAKALGEFGATITFVAALPGDTLTLPTAIYQAVQTPGGEARAVILCGIAAALATVAVLLANQLGPRLAGRRL